MTPNDLRSQRADFSRYATAFNNIAPGADEYVARADREAGRTTAAQVRTYNRFTRGATATEPTTQAITPYALDVATDALFASTKYDGNSARALGLSTWKLQKDFISYAIFVEMGSIGDPAATDTQINAFLTTCINIVENCRKVLVNTLYHIDLLDRLVKSVLIKVQDKFTAAVAEHRTNAKFPNSSKTYQEMYDQYRDVSRAIDNFLQTLLPVVAKVYQEAESIQYTLDARSAALEITDGVPVGLPENSTDYDFCEKINDSIRAIHTALKDTDISAEQTFLADSKIFKTEYANDYGDASLANLNVGMGAGFLTDAKLQEDIEISMLIGGVSTNVTLDFKPLSLKKVNTSSSVGNALLSILGIIGNEKEKVDSDLLNIERCYSADCDKTKGYYDESLNIELAKSDKVLGGTAAARDLVPREDRTLGFNIPIFGKDAANNIGRVYDFRERLPQYFMLLKTSAKTDIAVNRIIAAATFRNLEKQKIDMRNFVSHPNIPEAGPLHAIPANKSKLESFLEQDADTRNLSDLYDAISKVNVSYSTDTDNSIRDNIAGMPAPLHAQFSNDIKALLSPASMKATQAVYSAKGTSTIGAADHRLAVNTKLLSFARSLNSDLGLQHFKAQLDAGVSLSMKLKR